ncbi:MAG: AfsR/SARP family transcriptional regulator, partial [Ktedonobacteraceae bacterium]
MQMEQDIPASVVVRVYVLGPLEIWKKDPSGIWKLLTKDKWKNSKPARSIFKRLLVQPGRRLARSTIEDDVWSESDNVELATKNVYNAISLIRGIIGKPLATCWEAAYEIANQTLVWTDLDACAILLKEAENRRGSIQAIPLLEQAVTLLERGELLEGEDGKWCYAFRKRAEDLFRQASLWLAESYEAEGKLWQAGEQYRAMIFTNPSDEDALHHWIEMLARHGKRQEALKCYQDMKSFTEAQGFPLSSEMVQIVSSLKRQPSLSLTSLFPSFEGILGPGISRLFGAPDMDTLRRTITQSLLGMATATVVAPYNLDLLERFSHVLSKPSHLDDTTLCELENHTSFYWQHRLQATFPSAV